jgi:hypothetical protein
MQSEHFLDTGGVVVLQTQIDPLGMMVSASRRCRRCCSNLALLVSQKRHVLDGIVLLWWRHRRQKAHPAWFRAFQVARRCSRVERMPRTVATFPCTGCVFVYTTMNLVRLKHHAHSVWTMRLKTDPNDTHGTEVYDFIRMDM